MPKNKADRIRRNKKSLVKYLGELVRQQNGLCKYCNQPIVHVKSIPIKDRIEITNDWYLIYKHKRHVRKRLIATRDHVIPLKDGGPNTISNLVACCSQCNNEKDNFKGSHSR